MNRGVFALFVRTMREENRRVMTYVTRFLLVLLVTARDWGESQ
ncbi:MAG: hypothetical protein ACKVHP_14825 [Verrucomicrobiales bacterium]|jgi:hypothetical protein